MDALYYLGAVSESSDEGNYARSVTIGWMDSIVYRLYHLGAVSESSDEGNCYQAARSVTIGRMDYRQGLS